MSLLKRFFTHSAHPEGRMGRMMLRFMNFGHAPLTNCGLSHVTFNEGMTMLDIGCGGGATLQRLLKRSRNVRDAAKMFEEMEKVPTQEKFRETFEKIRGEEQQHISISKQDKDAVKTSFENPDKKKSKQDNINSKLKFNNNYDTKSKDEINKSLGFFEVFHEFERCNSRLHDWTESTFKKYHTLRNNLTEMRDYKRKAGLKFFDFTFEYFDEYGLQDFIDFLRNNKNYMNSSVTKNLSLIKVVIRWAYRRGFHNNNKFETFKPKMKTTQKKVVFLTKAELDKIENADLPETKLYLHRVRDVFLFQCYSGLRYSDVANLKRCDVHDDFFEITTIKTCDSLRIELNKHTKAILDKYKMFDLPKGKALPVISNQRMNEYVHELCEEANNTVFETVKTNMKSAPKKVVFFNMKELKQLEEYEIPKQNSHLEKTRDVFLFMCYTGLRYSDVANLKRCDILENHIEIVTEKTNVVLNIDLNTHSRRILQKYERYRFKKDAALPMISNQKMNQNLHELCKQAGFNQPIRIINYQGCQRIDEIKPKYEVIGTHTGRRSFICNAISMGIPPQVVMKWTGHSDYKAMKPNIDVCDEIKAEAMKKFDDP